MGFSQKLAALLQDDIQLCHYLLQQLSNKSYLYEFFIDCVVLDMTCILTGLVKIAIRASEFQINSKINALINSITIVIVETQAKKCQYLFKILGYMCKFITTKLMMFKAGILDILFNILNQIPLSHELQENTEDNNELGTYIRIQNEQQ